MPERPRPIGLADRDAVLALNGLHETELSPLDPQGLERLLAEAFHACMARDGQAFLIAFDQDAAYDSPNFLWFKERYDRFVYVDRVAVAAAGRGRGLARALYAELMERAIAAGHARIVCEVNSDPPNPASDAFHARLGFVEVGRARLEARGKSVRYLARLIDAGEASS